jgi:hypothetical protein
MTDKKVLKELRDAAKAVSGADDGGGDDPVQWQRLMVAIDAADAALAQQCLAPDHAPDCPHLGRSCCEAYPTSPPQGACAECCGSGVVEDERANAPCPKCHP